MTTSGQDELLALLQEEYLPKIYGFARMKLSSAHDADDLAGEITLQLVRHIRRGGGIENMNAFVWRVSNNMFFKYLRRKKHGNTEYLTELVPSDEDVEAELTAKEDVAAIRRELALLDEKYRRCVILCYFDGKTCEQIADIIGKPAGTVKWWLHEAKKFIKEGMLTMREFVE